ncbi:UvrD-helicase domain-containing protein [bacterium]|nr:UvrD-helicase domain-containing protein [bacterium]
MSQGLNRAQQEAVATLSGPMMVLAAAGTGKTRVITYRIANLIRNGIRPDRILAVTFTNKAAREMKERALKLLAKGSDATPVIGTFHSICVRILREEIGALGYPTSFSISDRSAQETYARKAIRECRIDPKELPTGDFLSQVSQWKNAGLRAEAALKEARARGFDERTLQCAKAYSLYEQSFKSAGMLDFDDLLLCTDELFTDHKDALIRHQERFDHLLVDEYQDTNTVQYLILRRLAARHRNICVVGDDDQSIYGWRGAEINNLKRLEKDFPGTKIVRLEENYRSCPNILRLANQLIRHNRSRYDKQLRSTRIPTDEPRFRKFDDESEEAAAVVADLASTMVKEKMTYRDFAILFRTNEQPRLFEQELRTRNIPYVLVGGYSFFDRREIRDVMSFLKMIDNPADEASLLRIVNVPPRGLGSTVVDRLVARASELGEPLWNILPSIAQDNVQPPRVRAGVERLLQIGQTYQRRLSTGSIAEGVRELLENDVNYRVELARQYDEPEDQNARWDSVGELINMISQYEERESKPTLRGFLENAALAGEEERKDSKEESKNAVTLMTMHSAKGLEFRHVYMVGMEMGILPHERSINSPSGIEEERRLAYVGVTRARDRLTLTRASKRRKFGKPRSTEPSIFLPEMFGQVQPTPSVRRENRSDLESTSSPIRSP